MMVGLGLLLLPGHPFSARAVAPGAAGGRAIGGSMERSSTRVSEILAQVSRGEKRAADELLPLVYDELRRLAQYRMSRLGPNQTLQATALVHEAYMRVVGDQDPGWDSRGHFFGAAAQAMRNILVERARRRGRIKHGGGLRRANIDEAALGGDERDDAEILALDEGLTRLEQEDARKGRIVMLRYFGGLSMDEIAELMQVSTRTVEREWRFARAWLRRELSAGEGA